jgi:hypothetical protein
MRKLVNSIGEWQVPRESVCCPSAVPLYWRGIRWELLLIHPWSSSGTQYHWFFGRTFCECYCAVDDELVFGNPPWLSPHLTERGSESEFIGPCYLIRRKQRLSRFQFRIARDSMARNVSFYSQVVLQKYSASHPGLCGAAPFPQLRASDVAETSGSHGAGLMGPHNTE